MSAAGHPLHPHPSHLNKRQGRKYYRKLRTWKANSDWAEMQKNREEAEEEEWTERVSQLCGEQSRHEEQWGKLSCELCLLLGQCFTGKQSNGL